MNILPRIGHALILGVLMASAVAAESQPLPPGVRRVPPERLGNYWLLDPASAEANVPNSGYGLDAPTCAAVSYLVEKNGTTSHVKLERLVPDGPLGKVAVNVVRGMRFAPAPQNAGKDAAYTYVVIPFNLPVASSPKAEDRALRSRVLEACQLADFVPAAK